MGGCERNRKRSRDSDGSGHNCVPHLHRTLHDDDPSERQSGAQIDDTTSSVFPDYTHDVLWVGGALGWLHKITGAFHGTPAEVTTGGFPVQVSATTTSISSPVYDQTSGNVFVGDASGFFYRVSSTGVVTKSGAGGSSEPVWSQRPSWTQRPRKVYVFSSSDGSTACAGAPCSAVYLFKTNFAANTTGTEATVGTSQAAPPNPNPLYEGSFRQHISSVRQRHRKSLRLRKHRRHSDPLSGSYRRRRHGNGAPGPALTSATTGCSPVTDISNPNATGGTAEWIFASAQASGLGT